jgi:hypothetical protein
MLEWNFQHVVQVQNFWTQIRVGFYYHLIEKLLPVRNVNQKFSDGGGKEIIMPSFAVMVYIQPKGPDLDLELETDPDLDPFELERFDSKEEALKALDIVVALYPGKGE